MIRPRACSICGRLLAEHEQEWRFTLPDMVSKMDAEERGALVKGNDMFLWFREGGGFLRIVLPIKLDTDMTYGFGTWLALPHDQMMHAYAVWDAPEYAEFRAVGELANAVPPWDDATLGRSAEVRVTDAEDVPVVVASTDPALSNVLASVWSHEAVLAAVEKRLGS